MGAASKIVNADSAGYWQAAKEGKLVFKTCLSCGHVQFPPRHICPVCWSERLEWREHSGKGFVHSFTIVHRAPLPEFATPYVVAMIALANGPKMISNIVGPGALGVRIGEAVEVTFEERDGTVLPMFRLADAKGAAS